MSCKEYQHQIVLFLYEELPEHEQSGLEAHLQQCSACKNTYQEQENLNLLLADDRAAREFPPDLLVESRSALANELDRIEQKRTWWNVPALSVVLTPMRMLESAALIALGLALGVYVSSQQAPTAPASFETAALSAIPQDGTVEDLRIVNVDPATGDVELAGAIVRPLRMRGAMNDEQIRSLVVGAALYSNNPGSRLQAVEALSQNPQDGMLKDALIHAMLHDVNAGVRLKALESLIPFAAQEEVATAFLSALENEWDPGIKIQAIEALTSIPQNDTVTKTIQEVAQYDDNPYVRHKGLQFVGNPR